MKAVEFDSMVGEGGHILLPPEVTAEIPAGEQLRVVLMWDPSGVERAWRDAGRRALESAYCPEDAVYEQLLGDESAPR